MKLVIDIPEKVYQNAKEDMLFGSELIANAIKNGVPQETVTEFADRCKECGAKYGRQLKHNSREIDDYENEIEDLHNRLNIAEGDKERLREEVANLETQINELKQELKTDSIPILKGTTNGDMWLKVFGGKAIEMTYNIVIVQQGKIERRFNKDWWDAPYKESGKE